jgi:hypothetical protein
MKALVGRRMSRAMRAPSALPETLVLSQGIHWKATQEGR